VREDLLDHHRVFNAGNDPDAAATSLAGLEIDVDHVLEALRLRLMAACRSGGVCSCAASGALAWHSDVVILAPTTTPLVSN
jgi:hypothetical protein